MFSTKIGTHVSFPLEGLDLQPFLAKDSPAQIVTYDLLSVICHHGTASSEYDCFVFAAGTSALFFKGDNYILKGKQINYDNYNVEDECHDFYLDPKDLRLALEELAHL